MTPTPCRFAFRRSTSMMRRLLACFTSLALLGLTFLAGCYTAAPAPTRPDDGDPNRAGASAEEKPANADKADKADIEALARGNNQFGLDLFRTLPRGNLFISPYSVSTALGMTFASNGGNVSEALARALHVPFSGERLNT